MTTLPRGGGRRRRARANILYPGCFAMRFRRGGKALLIGLFSVVLGAWPVAAQQHAAEVFTVRDVAVDVTAKTAAAAREAAHAQGHVDAMRRLLTRLLPVAQVSEVPELSAAQVAELVKDFEVADERTSDVRYLASLTFRFNPQGVRGFLRAQGFAHAETQSKPVLVLPVFGPAEQARLWADSNPWWHAWAIRDLDDGLVPLIVPLGDLADISAVTPEQALAGDLERLEALTRRYGAEDVLITQAVLQGEPEIGLASIQVGTSRIGRRQQSTIIDNVQQQPGEDLPDLFARAAAAVATEIQESWKLQNLLRPGSQRRITVTVPLKTLADWLEIKRRLNGVAGVQRSEVSLLSRRETEVDIDFVGDERQLALAMAQSDLSLTYEEASGWRLQLRGAEADSAPGGGQGAAAETGSAAPTQGAPAVE